MQKGVTILAHYTRPAALVGDKIEREWDVMVIVALGITAPV